MKNYHVIGMVFFAGLMLGAAIPAHAYLESVPPYITGVDKEECLILLNTGDEYSVDCDEMESFNVGDTVTMSHPQGLSTIYDEDTETESDAN
ncbi:hypothetical protein [Lelliottia wanjuensis]|uniref:hypothetical protein n=1 Tax=Lelliottia wanjuensis TaxID=3050585 RepID=UPI00254F1779|nr:hypothetical protein [Lelliottia sp. V86_10]MDK9585865.1 hypothetical protein [Lelliottia sp. V86_10]